MRPKFIMFRNIQGVSSHIRVLGVGKCVLLPLKISFFSIIFFLFVSFVFFFLSSFLFSLLAGSLLHFVFVRSLLDSRILRFFPIFLSSFLFFLSWSTVPYVTIPPRPPDTSTSSNHFASWPVINQWFRQGHRTFLHGYKKYNQGIGRCHVMAHGDEEVGMILPPVELTLSRSQQVTVRRECGSRRCSHLSDLGSPDIGRGKRK